MNLRPALLASVLLLANCSTQHERTTFAEIVERNRTLIQEYPERVVVELEADCKEGLCTVHEDNLSRLVQIITLLNDEVEKRIDAGNNLVNSLTHCEYANTKKDEALTYTEQKMKQDNLINSVKGFAYLALCGAGLIYGN